MSKQSDEPMGNLPEKELLKALQALRSSQLSTLVRFMSLPKAFMPTPGGDLAEKANAIFDLCKEARRLGKLEQELFELTGQLIDTPNLSPTSSQLAEVKQIELTLDVPFQSFDRSAFMLALVEFARGQGVELKSLNMVVRPGSVRVTLTGEFEELEQLLACLIDANNALEDFANDTRLVVVEWTRSDETHMFVIEKQSSFLAASQSTTTEGHGNQSASGAFEMDKKLAHAQILGIHKAAVDAGLTSSRAILLGGLNASISASLPRTENPSAQLWSDLQALNNIEPVDGSVPLISWLKSAHRLTSGLKQGQVFKGAIAQATSTLTIHNHDQMASGAQFYETSIANSETGKQYGLVMNGGGVKGLAFVGALLELEARTEAHFTAFGGTSAGSITATVLALGYDAKTIKEIICRQPFSSFLDSNWAPDWETPPWEVEAPNTSGWSAPWFMGAVSYLQHGFMFRSDQVGLWLRYLTAWRPFNGELPVEPQHTSDLKFSNTDLSKLMIVTATDGEDSTKLFSHSKTPQDHLAKAVRASMAIPVFFEPIPNGQEFLHDGGLISNFPVDEFKSEFGEHCVVGMYLYSAKSKAKKRSSRALSTWGLLQGLLRVWLGQDESAKLEGCPTIMLNIDPVQTVDFGLSQDERNLLIDVGRLGVLRFLFRDEKGLLPVKPGQEVSKLDYEALVHSVREQREKVVQVKQLRSKPKAKRALLRFVVVVLFGLASFFFYTYIQDNQTVTDPDKIVVTNPTDTGSYTITKDVEEQLEDSLDSENVGEDVTPLVKDTEERQADGSLDEEDMRRDTSKPLRAYCESHPTNDSQTLIDKPRMVISCLKKYKATSSTDAKPVVVKVPYFNRDVNTKWYYCTCQKK